MIFEHPETGLKLVVRRFNVVEEAKDLAGNPYEFIPYVTLETEAGQPCRANVYGEYGELHEVNVLTACGDLIRLVRSDPAQNHSIRPTDR